MAPARSTATRTQRPSQPRSPKAPPSLRSDGPARAPINLPAQRIFHLTHQLSLVGILADGGLSARATPAVELSTELTRELRASAPLADDLVVADAVPFFLSPNATQWEALRNGDPGTHWSREALDAAPSDFVVLASTWGAVADRALVSDSDAAGSLARIESEPAAAEALLRRLVSDDPRILEAEVLVPGSVPLDAVTLVGVANEKVRDAVKAQLADAGISIKVAVYPPWFQPSEL